MKKTISINIAGQIFKIDEDAYSRLKNYLDQVYAGLAKEPGGEETFSDIENRIAEIFGGGQESPVVITNDKVTEMISIMGAPEDYNAETPGGRTSRAAGKSVYNPGSLSARSGKILASMWKSVGKGLYILFRAIMIITGIVLSLLGFVLLFSFIATLFFNGTPLVRDIFEPDILNPYGLLSVVLNTPHVMPVIIVSSLVVIIPLAVITYLGIVMVFNLKNQSRIVSIIIFIVWVASVAVSGVLLSAKLAVYSNQKTVSSHNAIINNPDTLYLAPARRISDLKKLEKSGIDRFYFFRTADRSALYATVHLRINPADSIPEVFMEKWACGKSDYEALTNVRNIDFSYRLSHDTIYFDEYFTVKPGENWNGSRVSLCVNAGKGTIIKCLSGFDPGNYGLRPSGRNLLLYRITEDGYEVAEK